MKAVSLHIVSGFTLLAFLLPVVSGAASFTLIPSRTEVVIGDVVAVSLTAQSDECFNAFDGTITFDPNILAYRGFHDEGSIHPAWLEGPHESATGTIALAGGVFTGMCGGGDNLATTLLFEVIGESLNSAITLDSGALRAHDGRGTLLPTNLASTALSVTASTAPVNDWTEVFYTDVDAPDISSFTVASTDLLYDGDVFIAIDAKDDGVGVSHLVIRETSETGLAYPEDGVWRVFEGSALLADQTLESTVDLAAVDRAGNTSPILTLVPEIVRLFATVSQ